MNAVLPRFYSSFETSFCDFPPFPSCTTQAERRPYAFLLDRINPKTPTLSSSISSISPSSTCKDTGSTPVPIADSTPPLLPTQSSEVVKALDKVIHDVSSKPAYKEKTLPKTSKKDLPTPHTAPWIIQRLRFDLPEESQATLKHWMPHKRRHEFTEDLLQQVINLPDNQVLAAIRELKSGKQFVKGRGGNQLSIPVQLTMTSINQVIGARALVDSGCIGSCIDRDFVRQHKLPTEPTIMPIPIYNADGL